MDACHTDMVAKGFVPMAILLASLFGSGHCVAMCGGIVLAAAQTGAQAVAYHGGRLLAYMGLGALAGYLGGAMFNAALGPVSAALAVLVGGLFVLTGLSQFSGQLPGLSKVIHRANAGVVRVLNPVFSISSTCGLPFNMAPCK